MDLPAHPTLRPGDVVETGVFMGGSGIMMANVMKDWDPCGRRYFGFDSFQGLPQPDRSQTEDALGTTNIGAQGLFAAGVDIVKANFAKHGVDDPKLVQLIPGWFNESLPTAPVDHIAFLRLDGDLYISTWEALIYLYPKVAPGGLIYVDDYGSFNGCKVAVDKYRSMHRIAAPLHWIREPGNYVEAVWWRKDYEIQYMQD
eukprot:XP_001696765.1 predicted protein [Chlamydomonas reinhardtii]